MPSAITIIDAVPNFVSLEEHASIVAATPASFNDIPPVLRHKEENVSVMLDPPIETLRDLRGTLYVIESALVFMSDAGQGFEIKYPSITLHAISRADSGPSIYCQLDESDGAQDAEEDSGLRELTIVPVAQSSLEPIFEALSLCASLHPDGTLEDDDGDDDDAFISNGNFETFVGAPGEELSEAGRAAMEYLESILEDPKGLLEVAENK